MKVFDITYKMRPRTVGCDNLLASYECSNFETAKKMKKISKIPTYQVWIVVAGQQIIAATCSWSHFTGNLKYFHLQLRDCESNP